MAIEGRGDATKGGRIRLGMIGGGEGAFIGAVHRLAARMDGHYELVAGAFSSTPEKSRRSGEALGVAADRTYDDFESMAKAESARARRRRASRESLPAIPRATSKASPISTARSRSRSKPRATARSRPRARISPPSRMA